jgi:hypothetical protein
MSSSTLLAVTGPTPSTSCTTRKPVTRSAGFSAHRRASSHSALLEIELTRRNIPFVKFGGLKFIEAAHVKDMLAVLSPKPTELHARNWLETRRIRSGFRHPAEQPPGVELEGRVTAIRSSA